MSRGLLECTHTAGRYSCQDGRDNVRWIARATHDHGTRAYPSTPSPSIQNPVRVKSATGTFGGVCARVRVRVRVVVGRPTAACRLSLGGARLAGARGVSRGRCVGSWLKNFQFFCATVRLYDLERERVCAEANGHLPRSRERERERDPGRPCRALRVLLTKFSRG